MAARNAGYGMGFHIMRGRPGVVAHSLGAFGTRPDVSER